MPSEKEESDFLPGIAQQQFLDREKAIRAGKIQEANDKGLVPPVVASATNQPVKTETVDETPPKEEIMVPKWRFDEINSKYQELRTQAPPPKQEQAPVQVDVDKLVDQKLAPIRVQMEVDRILKDHQDFQELAPNVLERIKNKPALTLEEAYQLEKFSQIESKAKEEGKKEAYQVIEKKASLQVEQSGRRVQAPSVDDLIHDKSVPLSEIAKMLPH